MRDTYFITDLLRTNNNSVLIGNVDFGAAMATTGLINFFHSSSNFITTFQSGNATANATYTLPTAAPASTGFLQSTSAGVLSWQTSSSLGANDGTITDPGMFFITESDNGFWRPSANTINYASNSRNNLTMSNTLTQTWNRLRVLMSAVSGNSVTAAAGGTLPNSTYYYKIWSYDVNDVPGIPSPEMSVTTSGGNGTVNVAWSAVTGASYYRISRGPSSGTQDGYFQTSSTTYADTGAAFTGPGNGVVNNDGHIIVPGSIDLASSMGAIRWYNFTNGSIGASISGTSAGELEFATGKGGAQGNIIFADSFYTQKVKISTESTPVTFLFSDSVGWIDGRFQCLSLLFQTGSSGTPVSTINLSTTLVTSYLPVAITQTSNQLVLGATRTVTLTAPTPATASRTVTFPDLSGDYSVIGTLGAQSKSGSMTFSSGGVFLTAAPTNAYDTTNILYLNSTTSSARVIRYAGAIATDQMIYSPASTDEIRIATTTGTTITPLVIVNQSGGPQVELGNGSSGTNIRFNTATTTGANTATLTNSPTTGNPTGWMRIQVNDGTTRYVPYWT